MNASLHHSDRVVQYACGEYQKLLGLHGMTASMSRKGNCLDNAPMERFLAPMERFFGALKTEMVHRTPFRTRREARATLFEYIEIFYNQQQRHSSIGYRTPHTAPGKDRHDDQTGSIIEEASGPGSRGEVTIYGYVTQANCMRHAKINAVIAVGDRYDFSDTPQST